MNKFFVVFDASERDCFYLNSDKDILNTLQKEKCKDLKSTSEYLLNLGIELMYFNFGALLNPAFFRENYIVININTLTKCDFNDFIKILKKA